MERENERNNGKARHSIGYSYGDWGKFNGDCQMDDVNIRKERIERLLSELRYEITRGLMENEIEEEIGFRFFVPVSRNIPDGVVQCEFRTRPVPRGYAFIEASDGRLTVVKGGKA